MNLLVISDLHIGRSGKINSFGWNNQAFIAFLDNIIETMQIDKVVLNGDIYDLYQHSYSDIYTENKDLIEYFEGEKFVYVRGNHDFLMEKGLFEFDFVNKHGQTIHIEHGHNADFLNGTAFGRWCGRLGYDILKRLMKFDWVKNVFNKIVEHNDEINRIPRKYNTYKYLQYALKLLKKYDVVILGHTHKLETFKTYFLDNKKRYLNSGSCSLGRFQAAFINTETLKFDTIKISKEQVTNYHKKFVKLLLSA